ncbi:7-carboxy-7-deazaguanine synthase [Methanomicrobiaceae archaeon CYW5]|uniref:7-carboxy-7-deazaguanine synthase QueE n=1 Tax=Methanovulcanius yangii TaxID=1789227 RepID=UPI0029CA83D5|nr:radical SAM protein [Methanovulcanius yangii]MBT8508801.1 7-carboxy-7-deazaguanine synthase [Methanovulcanius yangii]
MRITEIFASISGEGTRQGAPAVFIRFAGCNLRCAWCDTGYSFENGTTMDMDAVLAEVARHGIPFVVITGGEPLLQEEELVPLLKALKGAGYDIEIETNGTRAVGAVQAYATVCMDMKCPSSGMSSDPALLATLRPSDMVKFVVADRCDCAFAEATLASHPTAAEAVISPVWGADYGEIVAFLMERRPPARLQVQLHKILGVQ